MAIRHYWPMAAAAVGFRLVLVLFGGDLHLASRPSLSPQHPPRRLQLCRLLAEGYWLKQASMSPYSDFIAAMLIRATGHRLNITRNRSLNSLELTEAVSNSVNISAGDIASLIYLWNPWAIVTCVGSCTSPIENLMVVIMIYGACSRLAPLAAFGYVMSTHLTLYPAILIVPIILLLGYGPDTPPAKVFRLKISSASKTEVGDSALYLGLLGLFATELAEMKLTFFLFFGYIGVSLLSPVMHNLWIWRGTGNANFYFATGLAYTCIQTVLVVESVSSMIKHDRKLRLLVTA
ncbi:Os01g0870201 [Oryza sativa Japonica Group]|uniref:Os01g0870201 protein n=1 Tax=Oryza sativa subsp. japonica TaxID=39947 RepID=A0A0P0VB18_ORYSJ|nr:hypothetical protein EE612_007058 [Oryza sativa]BAS75434.1 Os01g0870201 [Oryza sativa Japonica Group]